jgi:hypothetical protein
MNAQFPLSVHPVSAGRKAADAPISALAVAGGTAPISIELKLTTTDLDI